MAPTQSRMAAVLVPGGGYSTDGPLLMYAGLAVARRAGSCHKITWPGDIPPDEADRRAWVAGQVAAAIEQTTAATGVTAPLVIGKSLGSLAAGVVADRGLPAVWFTPLLHDEPTVAALRQARAPSLLIGGTADPVWDGAAARSVTPNVLEVPGADHGMFVPGELSASAAVLGQVISAVEHFLDHEVWP